MNKMKRVWILLLSLFCTMGTPLFSDAKDDTTVLISQVVDHPALDITTKGIIDALEEAGYQFNENLFCRVESAQANATLASQIATRFVSCRPDVVVGVGTLSAQSFMKYAVEKKAKLVFSSITDPMGAELVESLSIPNWGASGVSNYIELAPQIELFKTLQPTLSSLGILYNSGEVNSVCIAKQLEQTCQQFGIAVVEQTVSKTAEVPQSAIKLASEVDAIFISNDNTALSSLQSIIQIASSFRIPVYVSDTDAVALGAVAALGPNQYSIGQQTGKMIVRILQGEEIDHIPVEFPDKTDLYLNLEAAERAEIAIPNSILARATSIIEKSAA